VYSGAASARVAWEESDWERGEYGSVILTCSIQTEIFLTIWNMFTFQKEKKYPETCLRAELKWLCFVPFCGKTF